MTAIAHATIVMERTYNASPTRVFKAWSDVDARKRWSAPAEDIRIEYEAADFREGGRDVSRCIEPGNEDYVAVVHYLDIRRDQRIVFAEDVSHGVKRVSAALICVELQPAAEQTRLLLTMQIASFDGANMEQGYQFGWSAALDNLAKEFDQ
ncbi:MAG TPA: SRPBCC domain-containing protein [Vitreimonas sp.]|uniref:SRPBCC domain-containing protein n=1 Tax=Vitreimonas sp. TaxID=3069702 RepID=UPI002D352FFA|nr:SRPBCC domain-containing protein [Vitreimonas sp.]HYD88070.1 SRPBCC domain-containing protein [Vitreimonas sp.]